MVDPVTGEIIEEKKLARSCWSSPAGRASG
jgi:hypothetical protein